MSSYHTRDATTPEGVKRTSRMCSHEIHKFKNTNELIGIAINEIYSIMHKLCKSWRNFLPIIEPKRRESVWWRSCGDNHLPGNPKKNTRIERRRWSHTRYYIMDWRKKTSINNSSHLLPFFAACSTTFLGHFLKKISKKLLCGRVSFLSICVPFL